MPKLPNIRKRVLLPFFSTLVLLLSVATGVFLVNKQQIFRIGAWDCINYVFEVNKDGVVTVLNGSTRDEPQQQAKIFINGEQVAILDVPALIAGDAETIGSVEVPESGIFHWKVIGTNDCEDSGSYLVTPTPMFTLTPTVIPTQTITPTQTPVPSCPLARQGDINCDGVINILDFRILNSNFGTSDPDSDLNGDGTVNILDFQILSNNFGNTSG